MGASRDCSYARAGPTVRDCTRRMPILKRRLRNPKPQTLSPMFYLLPAFHQKLHLDSLAEGMRKCAGLGFRVWGFGLRI